VRVGSRAARQLERASFAVDRTPVACQGLETASLPTSPREPGSPLNELWGRPPQQTCLTTFYGLASRLGTHPSRLLHRLRGGGTAARSPPCPDISRCRLTLLRSADLPWPAGLRRNADATRCNEMQRHGATLRRGRVASFGCSACASAGWAPSAGAELSRDVSGMDFRDRSGSPSWDGARGAP
jgi:hypothetical protein